MSNLADTMTVAQIFDFYTKTGNTILARVNESQKSDDVVQATNLLMARLVQSGNTLRVLHDNATQHDWRLDGASILRTSYDAMLQALYIFHDSTKCEELARRFLDFRIIEHENLLRLFDKSSTTLSQQMANSPRRKVCEPAIKKEFERVCQKYSIDGEKRLPVNWYETNLRELAMKAGYEAEYEILQKQLSAIVHSSVFGIDGTSFFKPIDLMRFQWSFAFRVLDKVATFAGVELSTAESNLLNLSEPNIFDGVGFERSAKTE